MPFPTLHFDEIFMLKFEIFSTERTKTNAQKIRENVVVDKKVLM